MWKMLRCSHFYYLWMSPNVCDVGVPTSTVSPVSGTHMKSIFLKRTTTNLTHPTHWRTHAEHVEANTNAVGPHTTPTSDLAHATSYPSSLIREQNTALAQGDEQFFFTPARRTTVQVCAFVYVCTVTTMAFCVRARVCVLPIRLHHLYLPIQDIRLTVLSQTLLARLSTEESMTWELLTH